MYVKTINDQIGRIVSNNKGWYKLYPLGKSYRPSQFTPYMPTDIVLKSRRSRSRSRSKSRSRSPKRSLKKSMTPLSIINSDISIQNLTPRSTPLPIRNYKCPYNNLKINSKGEIKINELTDLLNSCSKELSNYSIQKKLGAGSFGSVYLAYVNYNPKFDIKVMNINPKTRHISKTSNIYVAIKVEIIDLKKAKHNIKDLELSYYMADVQALVQKYMVHFLLN